MSCDRDIFGQMSMRDCNRNGFRAVLNKQVDPGCDLVFEVKLPKQERQLWAKGRVVWTRNVENDIIGEFDVGGELSDIDLFDRHKVVNECYKNKYLEQVADYAIELGAYAKRNKNNFFTSPCGSSGLLFYAKHCVDLLGFW